MLGFPSHRFLESIYSRYNQSTVFRNIILRNIPLILLDLNSSLNLAIKVPQKQF